MLQLKNIKKDYNTSSMVVKALKGISLNFRKSEFVAILGPSGCGKTTMLNIIGGLDNYTSGDLIINNKSTKSFKNKDWDDYRNKSIGFVFQNYNLIQHQNVLNNVAMGLTLSGINKKTRIGLAKEALDKVGLKDMIYKLPNQLSGGQMQRVAIARAIVSNPDIILADEPTGALDSETGITVMNILKEISKEKLVIMVTHNSELATKYSTRIIKLFDGKVIEDSNKYYSKDLKKDEKKDKEKLNNIKKKKVSMKLSTAFNLSFKTLLSKKGRTIITSIAGSIGIFAITLILAISNGMNLYINNLSSTALGSSAITISETTTSVNLDEYRNLNLQEKYPKDTTGVIPYNSASQFTTIKNNITDDYINYLENLNKSLVKTIEYSYSAKMNIITKTNNSFKLITNSSNSGGGFSSLIGLNTSFYDVSENMFNNEELIKNSYDILYKTNQTGLPQNYTELTLVVDRYNRLSTSTLTALGIEYNLNLDEISYENIVAKEYKLILNNDFYTLKDSKYQPKTSTEELEELYSSPSAITLKIVGIIRLKNDDSIAWQSNGLIYSHALTDFVMLDAINSNVGTAQINNTIKNVLTGENFVDSLNLTIEDQYKQALKNLGVYTTPTLISIYPQNINNKEEILNYLDAWNKNHEDNKMEYVDFSEIALNILNNLIDIISYVLIAFCAISLVVSTVMISVTTYTSVVERTKEIGILRSLGARKKDISQIFNAETIIIGFFAGIIGIAFSILVGVIINSILLNLINTSIVVFNPITLLTMLLLSVFLTWLAGLIPAKIASNKDPVICLRAE